MFKATFLILAATMALVPMAAAQPKQVTLAMDYDPALLSSETGAQALVSDLTREAHKLCSQRMPALGTLLVDKDCAADLVKAAVQQIHAEHASAGQEIAPGFQKLAAVDHVLAN